MRALSPGQEKEQRDLRSMSAGERRPEKRTDSSNQEKKKKLHAEPEGGRITKCRDRPNQEKPNQGVRRNGHRWVGTPESGSLFPHGSPRGKPGKKEPPAQKTAKCAHKGKTTGRRGGEKSNAKKKRRNLRRPTSTTHARGSTYRKKILNPIEKRR